MSADAQKARTFIRTLRLSTLLAGASSPTRPSSLARIAVAA